MVFSGFFSKKASKAGTQIFTPLTDTVKEGQLQVPLDCITSVVQISNEQTVIGVRNRANLGFGDYISFNGDATIADNVDGADAYPLEESAPGNRSQAGYLKAALERRIAIGEDANFVIDPKDANKKGAGVTLHINQAEPEVDPLYGFQRLTFDGLTHLIETAKMSGVNPVGVWVREGTADPLARALTQRETGHDSFLEAHKIG